MRGFQAPHSILLTGFWEPSLTSGCSLLLDSLDSQCPEYTQTEWPTDD